MVINYQHQFKKFENSSSSRTIIITITNRSTLQPHTPVRPGRVQLEYVSSWTEFTEDFGHYAEGPRGEYGGAKPDWAAKITGHCSRDTTSDGIVRPYYQDAK